MKSSGLSRFLVLSTACLCMTLSARGVDVPLELPKPDGKPGGDTKPVKVYILAGQSNMVGFGRYTGTSPYTGIFLTADPQVLPGKFVAYPSTYMIARHGIYPSADAGDSVGAQAAVYPGAYDPTVDYAGMTPVKQASVPLGSASTELPSLPGPHTTVVTGFIDVPESGSYQLHAGWQASSHSIVKLAGQEVYRKALGGEPVLQTVALEADQRYKVEITYLAGGSAAFWLEQVNLTGKGDLTNVTKTDKEFTYLLDDNGDWSVRNDVIFAEARIAAEGRWCPLTATSNGKHIGPELGFGYVLGEFHDEQVLLIKSAMGNRSLNYDFRPPSSGKGVGGEGEGIEYRLTVKGVETILAKIDQVIPDYKGQGYEIAGFVWWQGHKDRGQTKAQYEQHMVNLIADLRAAFKAPKMLVAIATVAFDGAKMIPEYIEILKAQQAVADPQQHPELAGTVKTVDARGFWYSREQSPTGVGYHYNHNARTYMLTGDALGRAMVGLRGGTVEPRPLRSKPDEKVEIAAAEPTEAQLATHKAAVQPLVVDGMLPCFIANPRNQPAIDAILQGERPARGSQFVRDALDHAIRHYRALDIHDYDWKAFGHDLQTGEWEYTTTDGRLPAEAKHWFSPEFDAGKMGWQTGASPFGSSAGKLVALSSGCNQAYCGCGITPGTLWDKKVLYMRKRIAVPPLKSGHRYRVVVGGASHVKSGAGWTLYVNGKQLGSGGAVRVRQGGQPRGAHFYADLLPELESGQVTFAVTSSLWKGRTSPRGHLSIRLEEQKIPEQLLPAATPGTEVPAADIPQPEEGDGDRIPTETASITPQPFPGQKSLFSGTFDMYKDGGNIVVVPKQAAKGKPWVWRARFWRHEPQFDVAMLQAGYHIVYCDVGGLLGNPTAVERWNEYYRWLTVEHGFAKKVVLEGMSRGGLIIYNWAIANPGQVAAIYGDAPVMDLRSWPGFKSKGVHRAYSFEDEAAFNAFTGNPVDNLAPLAQAKIPIIHVVGDKDTTVPVAENTAIAETRYKQMGGTMEVIHKAETGHHPHSLKDPTPIVQFIQKHSDS